MILEIKRSAFSLLTLIVFLLLSSCAFRPRGTADELQTPPAPDYSNNEHWAALPSIKDSSDNVPNDLIGNKLEDLADVFFLHPTTFTGRASKNEWNASIDDKKINQKTDETSILFQGSIFNGVGQVYAPRYRQAHYRVFFTSKHLEAAKAALELAYEDVKSAFEYYLKNHNNGRPIIIAAHSQGALHAKQILKDYFEEKPLMDQLVVAYLVGWPIEKDYFEELKICKDSLQTQCFCTWRTFKKGAYPRKHHLEDGTLVVNPLSWTTETSEVPHSANKGAIITDFDEVLPNIVNAQISEGVIWVEKPKFPGSIFYLSKNYHPGDFNLFYVNVRLNALERARNFLKQE